MKGLKPAIGRADNRDQSVDPEMIEQRAVEVAMFKRKGLKLPQWGAAEEPASHTETRPQPV